MKWDIVLLKIAFDSSRALRKIRRGNAFYSMATVWYSYCVRFCEKDNLRSAFICWGDCLHSSHNIYLHRVNSNDCVVPFSAFSATTAHWLATHVTMCHIVEIPQVLQAHITLRGRVRAPPTGIRNLKSGNPCYSERPCYRPPSYIEESHYETPIRAPERNSGNDSPIELRIGEDFISRVKSDKCQEKNLRKRYKVPL